VRRGGSAKTRPKRAFPQQDFGWNFASSAVDKAKGRSLYSPHDGAPPAFGRGRCCFVKLLTSGCDQAPVSVGGFELRRLSRQSERGIARFPGCLTSESEERETWTAESLRAASSIGEGLPSSIREAAGRDNGGTRF
jgi:hypothetical protein